MARLTLLPAPVPDRLEVLLGYEGDAEWLAVYVDIRTGEVVGDDGHVPFVVAADAYRLYTEHRAVAPHLASYDLEFADRPARHRLVLNRVMRTLFVASSRAVRVLVRAQWPEPPRPPQGAEIGTLLAQWTWRLRTEATPAGQAATAIALAARPRELQGLRSWLDDQVMPTIHALPARSVVPLVKRSPAETGRIHEEGGEQE